VFNRTLLAGAGVLVVFTVVRNLPCL
jgi:hypothetical protein